VPRPYCDKEGGHGGPPYWENVGERGGGQCRIEMMAVLAMPVFAEVEFPPIVDQPLNPGWDLGVAAQHVVLFHFREVLRQRQAVWENVEMEAVHEIRVAARRTRTALQTLRPLWVMPEVGRFERYLERFATAFGAARDLDVLIVYFEELLKDAAGERAAAYRWLLERNRERRALEQPRLERVLTKMEESGFPVAFTHYFSSWPIDLWLTTVPHG